MTPLVLILHTFTHLRGVPVGRICLLLSVMGSGFFTGVKDLDDTGAAFWPFCLGSDRQGLWLKELRVKSMFQVRIKSLYVINQWFFSTADVSQTFGLFSCCRQQCWCHWSCRLFSVYILRSLCCPSVVSNQKQNNSQLNNQSEHHSPHGTSTLNLFKLDETMQLRDSNQQFTNCLSNSSCLCSQSASERTMVSWHSEEEEASPLLEVVTPEERGVSGIRVSSSILRSCCDEADSFLVAPKHFLHIFYLGA